MGIQLNESQCRPWHTLYPAGLAPVLEIPAIRLPDFVRRAADRTPESLALVAPGAGGHEVRLSFRELWRECECFGGVLSGIGISSDRAHVPTDPANPCDAETAPRVMLWLPNVLAFVVAYEGALLAGCIVTAASPALRVDELSAQIRDAGPRVLVLLEVNAADGHEAVALAGHDGTCHVMVVDEEGRSGLNSGPPPVLATTDFAREVAVLQYTSGTTGQAKGAAMTQRNLVANALQNAQWFQWGANGEAIINLAVLPLCHTWGMCCCLNSTFAVGGTLVLADQRAGFDPDHTCGMVERHGATVLYGSATMFHRLMDCATDDVRKRRAHLLRSLRHVKAGAMLSQGNLKGRWDSMCPSAPLQQGYGLTEASPESHNNPPERIRKGTVGVPIQSTDCRICAPGDPLCVHPTGEAGEVQLSGPQITLGYWRRPDATESAFVKDGGTCWLRTGDIGVMGEEGYLTIVDRMKDLIKFRGWSISPNNIEECLLHHSSIQEAVVVGRLDERDGEVPTACVVLHGVGDGLPRHHVEELPAPSGTIEALLAHCVSHLGAYEVPREWHVLAAIPKNHVAKPLRRMVRDWVRERSQQRGSKL